MGSEMCIRDSPIDPQLAALSDAGMIETYGGQFLEGAADACEKLLK